MYTLIEMRKSLAYLIVLIPISGIAVGDDGESARERYDAALAQALEVYLAEIEEEIRAAGAEGDLEEANRLAAERDTIEETPAEQLAADLVGTRWNFGNGRFIEFRANGMAINNAGDGTVWIASDEQTVLQQNQRTQDIFVWKFSEDLESVSRYSFKRSERVDTPRRVSR